MRVMHIRSGSCRIEPILICALLLALGLAGCSGSPSPDVGRAPPSSNSPTSPASPASAPLALTPPAVSTSAASQTVATAMPAVSIAESATTGLIALSALPVRPRGVKTGYSRDQYGIPWTDDVLVDGGGNGCSTREDILRRDLSAVVMVSASDVCKVLSGVLNDQYTATVILYLDGESSPIDIDHVVSLSDSWQSGTGSFTPKLRQSLADDPLNLQAVSRQANQQKGDGDAATWLPPNKAYRCEYVHRQIDVKVKYGLWVKPAELGAMRRVLAGCGGVPPTNLGFGSTTPDSVGTATVLATTDPAIPRATGGDYFANCAAAEAAGRAPLLRGEEGYRPEMDGDNDGVACEAHR